MIVKRTRHLDSREELIRSRTKLKHRSLGLPAASHQRQRLSSWRPQRMKSSDDALATDEAEAWHYHKLALHIYGDPSHCRVQTDKPLIGSTATMIRQESRQLKNEEC